MIAIGFIVSLLGYAVMYAGLTNLHSFNEDKNSYVGVSVLDVLRPSYRAPEDIANQTAYGAGPVLGGLGSVAADAANQPAQVGGGAATHGGPS